MFYCRDSAVFSASATNKLSCKLTVKCFEIGNKNIPLSVTSQFRTTYNEENRNVFDRTDIFCLHDK